MFIHMPKSIPRDRDMPPFFAAGEGPPIPGAGTWNWLTSEHAGILVNMATNAPTTLGEGGTSRVLKALFMGFVPAALKEYKEWCSERFILREANLMHFLQDIPYIPRLYGVTLSNLPNAKPGLLMQRLEGESLLDYACSSPKLPRQRYLEICLDLANAIKSLHHKGVLYNDLTWENVIIVEKKENYQLYLIDLGDASYGRGRTYTVNAQDQADQIAPEVRRGSVTSNASDTYSYGFLVGAMMGWAEMYDDPIRRIVANCTCEDPSMRWSMKKVHREVKSIYKRQFPGKGWSFWGFLDYVVEELGLT